MGQVYKLHLYSPQDISFAHYIFNFHIVLLELNYVLKKNYINNEYHLDKDKCYLDFSDFNVFKL